MVFSTLLFLFRFLPITLALYYLAPAKWKNTVLFLCSLVFYSWGEVRLFPVMAAAILINLSLIHICRPAPEAARAGERRACHGQKRKRGGPAGGAAGHAVCAVGRAVAV